VGEFRRFVGSVQVRVDRGELAASSAATYIAYVTQRFPQFRQAAHLGGEHRAPHLSEEQVLRLRAFLFSPPATPTKVGMWLQSACGAPCIDVSRLRSSSLIFEGGVLMQSYWSWTKTIKTAADAKSVSRLKKLATLAPFTEKEWLALGGEYCSAGVNSTLRSLFVGFYPVPTSTSLRLLLIKDAEEENGGDYEKCARFTVHKSGQVISSNYDAPRVTSHRTLKRKRE